jgi:Na+-transporting NADH:ubiquinone oxidoreductase subunit NqrB
MGRSLDMTWNEWATLLIAASVGAVVGKLIFAVAGRKRER